MLYLVGLGLYDEKDLSLKGLEAVKKSDVVYAEFYTSFFGGSTAKLEKLCGRKITLLTRKDLEEKPEELLNHAKNKTVSLLVCGDPMVATTHIDLTLRARKLGIDVKIIHASSVYSAVAETGLQIYKFGKTTTLPYPEKNYRPTSPYDTIVENKERGLHTLVLLDVKEEEGKYMTVSEAVELLLKMGEKEETMVVGAARLGGDAKILYAKAGELLKKVFGAPPHIIIVPGKLHFMEEEALKRFSLG